MARHDLLSFSPDSSDCVISMIHCQTELPALAWNLNQAADTIFWRRDVNLNLDATSPPSAHEAFYYQNHATENRFWLISNQGSHAFLAAGKPRPDYILVGFGDGVKDEISDWTDKLKTKNTITLAYFVDQAQIKKLHWLLWLEYNEESNTDDL